MTKSLNFFTVMLIAAAGVGMVAEGAFAQTMQFLPTKDVGINAHQDEQMFNHGQRGQIKGLKKNQQTMILDFDSIAIKIFLQANSGNAVWTLNVQPSSSPGAAEVPCAGGGHPTISCGDIQVMTVESLTDWSEGDGQTDSNYNWTSGTPAATYFYAQTVHNGGVLDAAASIEWIDPDSGPYTFTQRDPNYATYGVPTTVGGGTADTADDPTPEFTNSAVLTKASLETAFGDGNHASVVLDADIVDALLNDPFNRGLRTGPLINTENANWRIWDKDQSGGLFAPFLEVTITPIVGQPGDFDGDLDVDGADFLKWQRDGLSAADLVLWENNYGTSAPLAAASAVPEPSSIALLALSSALLLARRSSCRS